MGFQELLGDEYCKELYQLYDGKKSFTDKFIDKPADWGDTYKPYTVYTEGKLNYFTVRQETIQNYAK